MFPTAPFMTEDNETSDELEGEDLEYVLKLNAAMGWGAMMLMNKEKSIYILYFCCIHRNKSLAWVALF